MYLRRVGVLCTGKAHFNRAERERDRDDDGGGGGGGVTKTVNKHSDSQSRRGCRALRSNWGCLTRGQTDRTETERGLRGAGCRWMC